MSFYSNTFSFSLFCFHNFLLTNISVVNIDKPIPVFVIITAPFKNYVQKKNKFVAYCVRRLNLCPAGITLVYLFAKNRIGFKFGGLCKDKKSVNVWVNYYYVRKSVQIVPEKCINTHFRPPQSNSSWILIKPAIIVDLASTLASI